MIESDFDSSSAEHAAVMQTEGLDAPMRATVETTTVAITDVGAPTPSAAARTRAAAGFEIHTSLKNFLEGDVPSPVPIQGLDAPKTPPRPHRLLVHEAIASYVCVHRGLPGKPFSSSCAVCRQYEELRSLALLHVRV